MPWRDQLALRLPLYAKAALKGLSDEDAAVVREVRFRMNSGMTAYTFNRVILLRDRFSNKDMEQLVASLCGGAVYAYERTMAEGYIALPGGHRAGLCGRLTRDESGNVRMSHVTSVCIRITRQIHGASAPVRRYLLDEGGRPVNALILGPPGSGKTTLLRDATIWYTKECGLQVAVADEREELFPEQNQEGEMACADVMRGGKKSEMMGLMLRSMSPDVMVCDEIGDEDDAAAILNAARCGAALLTSAHADGIDAILKRPVLNRLLEAKVFARYIVLGGAGIIIGVYDQEMKQMKMR